MTRETKLGLAVATSFLSLVGGVLGVKLYRGDGPDAAPTEAVAKEEPKKPEEPTPQNPQVRDVADVVKQEAERKPMPSPAPAEPAPVLAVATPAPPAPSQPEPSDVALNTPDPTKVVVVPPPAALDKKDDTPPAAPPIKMDPPPAMEPAKKEPPVGSDIKVQPPAPVSLDQKKDEQPPAPVNLDKKKDELATPVPANLEKKDEVPTPAPVNLEKKDDVPPAPVNLDEKKDEKLSPTPVPPAPINLDQTTAAPPAPVNLEPKKDDAPPPPIKFDKPPGSTSVAPPPAPARNLPPLPEPPASTPPAPLNPEINKKAEPTVTVIPAGSPASLGAPASPPKPRDPFLAATPRPPAEPKTQSYLEEEHRWQPADNFRALSERFYFSPKYETALKQYNRDYPLATKAMKQNPATLPPGTTVWVPPVRILERDYPDLIGELTPAPGVTPATPASRPGSLVTPVPPPPAAGPPYTVQAGETLYEIARRTLGGSDQWYQIYRMNPTLSNDPKLPIPAGTFLRMPAGAKVGAANRP